MAGDCAGLRGQREMNGLFGLYSTIHTVRTYRRVVWRALCPQVRRVPTARRTQPEIRGADRTVLHLYTVLHMKRPRNNPSLRHRDGSSARVCLWPMLGAFTTGATRIAAQEIRESDQS